jgi:hypothetical protein
LNRRFDKVKHGIMTRLCGISGGIFQKSKQPLLGGDIHPGFVHDSRQMEKYVIDDQPHARNHEGQKRKQHLLIFMRDDILFKEAVDDRKDELRG